MKKKLVNYILIALGSIMLSNCNKQTENQDAPLSFDSNKKLGNESGVILSTRITQKPTVHAI